MEDGAAAADSDLVRVLRGAALAPPPIWMMRQAGRYLPEYRALRSEARDFLAFCYTPDLAVEATLQPMRRFAFDASIIFSDILVLPDALGQRVWFVEGEGPRLEPLRDTAALSFSGFEERLATVYSALARVRAALPREKALFGFCGAPWTLATYMLAGQGGEGRAVAAAFAAAHPATVDRLVDLLVEACTRHLLAQIRAGADAVQIFDSWAGMLGGDDFARWSIAPTRRIVEAIRAAEPAVPIVGFPRGAGTRYAAYAQETGVDAVSLDQDVPLAAARALQAIAPVQGNLDPLLLAEGGAALDAAVGAILDALGEKPFVFNLGHGIVPATPPANVARVIDLVKAAA